MHLPDFTIGSLKRNSDTPQLCLDLDAFESNLSTMAKFVAAKGKNWRPHSKCHKTPEVATRQMAAGSIGVTCAKVSEAEIFARSGIRDILLAHLPVGPSRVSRIAALCEIATPVVSCDHFVQAEQLSEACLRRGV
ncbi:MAG: DSD1 family PLP-dependent enzyme, partial [Planctomycetes bacterium]|nr:DSD1 family PLP-dependent enzyme [Planctomycetota bacterium]